MPTQPGSTILIPVDLASVETPPTGIIDLLSSVDAVLLGYYPVPAQTAPAQIKNQKQSEAAQRLETIAEGLTGADGGVTEVLVFTHDREDTVDRIADEYDCDAILSSGTADTVERVLVPLRGEANLDRIVSFVADLLGTTDASITLFHVTDEKTDGHTGASLLDNATDRLDGLGIAHDRVETRLSDSDDPSGEIVELAAEFDVLVIDETDTPVFVVRKREE